MTDLHPAQEEMVRLMCSVWLLGPPRTPAVERLVVHLFSPDEAEVARYLPFYRRRPVDEVARRAGRPVDEVQPLLDSLSYRFVIMGGRRGYGLLPIVPGMFEYVLMGGENTAWHRRYSELFEEVIHSGYASAYTQSSIPAVRNVPDVREIPVGQTLDSRSAVVDADLMEEMLAEHELFGMLNVCQCRQSRHFTDKRCRKAGVEDGCLIFGSFAHKSIDRGRGRRLDRHEMRDLVAQRREQKLVFLAGNVSADSPNVICTCCECCCHLLQTVNEWGGHNWLAAPRYLAAVDDELCDHCGLCRPACGTRAHEVRKKVHTYQRDRCIGCGNCLQTCPQKAIILEPNRRYRRPSPDFDRLARRLVPGIGWTMLRARLGR